MLLKFWTVEKKCGLYRSCPQSQQRITRLEQISCQTLFFLFSTWTIRCVYDIFFYTNHNSKYKCVLTLFGLYLTSVFWIWNTYAGAELSLAKLDMPLLNWPNIEDFVTSLGNNFIYKWHLWWMIFLKYQVYILVLYTFSQFEYYIVHFFTKIGNSIT